MGLLTLQNIDNQVFLVVGDSPLARRRGTAIEGAGAVPVFLPSAGLDDLTSRGRTDVDKVVDGVFVVDTEQNGIKSTIELVNHCKRLRIPINVAEHPHLCTFSLPSTFRDGNFQLAVSTGGKGCRLANRLKRAALSALPQHPGAICDNIGDLRQQLLDSGADAKSDTGSHDDDAEQTIELNAFTKATDPQHRLRWLDQMVEYYPLRSLETLTLGDLEDISGKQPSPSPSETKKGKISLVGAGPGSSGLLTTEALREITSADYVLADKLVPEEVLALVPRRTPVFIARKFPGNAERAQQELLEKGLGAVEQGQHVVRLKQGDPYIYGRGAEEYLFFQEHGYTPKVVAGVTSALAAPLLANIPATHRGAADQILICTGTGRNGAQLEPPEYVPTRTVVFLMALHRIESMVEILVSAGWDPDVPCASIERASCPDQRVVRTTLRHIADALNAVGSRPPGLLVVGQVCHVLFKGSEKWTVEE